MALVAAEQSGVPLDDPALAPARARLDAHVGGARRRDGALAMLAKASAARCARVAHISNSSTASVLNSR